jgi:hypothetical protein
MREEIKDLTPGQIAWERFRELTSGTPLSAIHCPSPAAYENLTPEQQYLWTEVAKAVLLSSGTSDHLREGS